MTPLHDGHTTPAWRRAVGQSNERSRIDQNHTWQRQNGEPEPAYLRFLYYRGLGPARSLLSAYRAYAAEHGEELPAGGQRHVPGQWGRECRTWNWPARARAWDACMVRVHGHDAVIALVAAVRAATHRLLEAIDRLPGPENWQQVLESLAVLSQLIPAEAVAAVLQSGEPLTEPTTCEGGSDT